MLMNPAPGFFFLDDSMGVDVDHRILVYGGDEHFETRHGRILRLQDLPNSLIDIMHSCGSGGYSPSQPRKSMIS